MKRSTIGAFLLLLFGLAVIGAAYIIWPMLQDSRQVATSDAAHAKGTITSGVDAYIGYYPYCSSYMRGLMLADGYKFDCRDDGADYKGRLQRLKDGGIDFAVATVDTYILNGASVQYPGTGIMVIDRSAGADAILAWGDRVPNLESLKTRLDLKVAFAKDTPSDFLRKFTGTDFDIPLFRSTDPNLRIETKNSEEALQKLLSGEADVAIVWEPEVRKGLARAGIVKLFSTAEADRKIVDKLLVSRRYATEHPDEVRLVLANYFKTLKHYRENPDVLRKEVAAYAGVSESDADVMLKGVAWPNLTENALEWMGVKDGNTIPINGLYDAIEAALKTLVNVGDFADNPLPRKDPRLIIDSRFITALYNEDVPGSASGVFMQSRVPNSLEANFSALDDAGWKALREVSSLRRQNVQFQSGTATLTLDDKTQLDETADALKSYPKFRIEVRGHTKPGGDEAANKILSDERAEAVMRYMTVTYGIDANRIRAVGLGSTVPLPQPSNESYRSYRDRLARVEIVLLRETM